MKNAWEGTPAYPVTDADYPGLSKLELASLTIMGHMIQANALLNKGEGGYEALAEDAVKAAAAVLRAVRSHG